MTRTRNIDYVLVHLCLKEPGDAKSGENGTMWIVLCISCLFFASMVMRGQAAEIQLGNDTARVGSAMREIWAVLV